MSIFGILSLSDPDLAQEIRTAQRRKEVTRLEALVEESERRGPDQGVGLNEATTKAKSYLDNFGRECLRILRAAQ